MKLLIIILSLLPVFSAGPSRTMWVIGKESSVTITGISNVNSFRFTAPSYQGRDTLVFFLDKKENKVTVGKGVVRLPVKNFKNGNPVLSKDFKKILKYKQHPDIIMDFKSLVFTGGNQASPRVNADIEITLAGVTIRRSVILNNEREKEVMYLTGKECLLFSDFNLKPPSKIMGFIDVKNELEVDFRLVMQEIRN